MSDTLKQVLGCVGRVIGLVVVLVVLAPSTAAPRRWLWLTVTLLLLRCRLTRRPLSPIRVGRALRRIAMVGRDLHLVMSRPADRHWTGSTTGTPGTKEAKTDSETRAVRSRGLWETS